MDTALVLNSRPMLTRIVDRSLRSGNLPTLPVSAIPEVS